LDNAITIRITMKMKMRMRFEKRSLMESTT